MGLTPRAKGEPDLIPVLKQLAEAGYPLRAIASLGTNLSF
jgi:hypothetical protein